MTPLPPLPAEDADPWYAERTAWDEAVAAEVEALPAALADKSDVGHAHALADVTGLDAALAGKAPTVHTHLTADVTDLDAALAGKAPTVHTHATADVTGLDTALAGKAPTVHTHSSTDVTDFDDAVLALIPPSSGSASGLHPPISGDVLVPLGVRQTQDSVMVADRVTGCPIQIVAPCSLLWARIEVRLAAPALATADIVLYKADTLALVGTFGSVAIDSTGKKTATPASPIAITAPGIYIAAFRARAAIGTTQIRTYPPGGIGQPITPWNDWDYPPEPGFMWTVPGITAAPSSLVGYAHAQSPGTPVVMIGVTP